MPRSPPPGRCHWTNWGSGSAHQTAARSVDRRRFFLCTLPLVRMILAVLFWVPDLVAGEMSQIRAPQYPAPPPVAQYHIRVVSKRVRILIRDKKRRACAGGQLCSSLPLNAKRRALAQGLSRQYFCHEYSSSIQIAFEAVRTTSDGSPGFWSLFQDSVGPHASTTRTRGEQSCSSALQA